MLNPPPSRVTPGHNPARGTLSAWGNWRHSSFGMVGIGDRALSLCSVCLSQASPEDGFFCSEVPSAWTPPKTARIPYLPRWALIWVGRNGLRFYFSLTELVFTKHLPPHPHPQHWQRCSKQKPHHRPGLSELPLVGEACAHQETAPMRSPFKLSELLGQGNWKLTRSWLEVAGAREGFSEDGILELELYFESSAFVPLPLR